MTLPEELRAALQAAVAGDLIQAALDAGRLTTGAVEALVRDDFVSLSDRHLDEFDRIFARATSAPEPHPIHREFDKPLPPRAPAPEPSVLGPILDAEIGEALEALAPPPAPPPPPPPPPPKPTPPPPSAGMAWLTAYIEAADRRARRKRGE
jgi:hypothetical protein